MVIVLSWLLIANFVVFVVFLDVLSHKANTEHVKATMEDEVVL